MTIETKFNLGDEVWFMRNNKANSGRVYAIKISVGGKSLYGEPQINVLYSVNVVSESPVEGADDAFFPDKPSLLASL